MKKLKLWGGAGRDFGFAGGLVLLTTGCALEMGLGWALVVAGGVLLGTTVLGQVMRRN